MKDISKIDFTALDRPEALMFLFHPRPESTGPFSKTADPQNRASGPRDILIPVQDDIAVNAANPTTFPPPANFARPWR